MYCIIPYHVNRHCKSIYIIRPHGSFTHLDFFESRPNPQVTARLLAGRKVLGVTSTNGKRDIDLWICSGNVCFSTPLDSHLWQCASAIWMAMARCTSHPTIFDIFHSWAKKRGEFGQVLPVFNILKQPKCGGFNSKNIFCRSNRNHWIDTSGYKY